MKADIPKDLNEYDEKIFFGLSLRQLTCLVVACTLGGLTYFFVRKVVGDDIAGYLIVIEVLPLLILGFVKLSGQSIEDYARIILKHKMSPYIRVYETSVESRVEMEKGKRGNDKKKKEYSAFEFDKRREKRNIKIAKAAAKRTRKELKETKKRIRKAA